MLRTKRQLIYSFIVLITVILLGTAGYSLLEDWNILDAFFMTVITITTIGYKEVYPLSEPGMLFTVFLIFVSVGAVFYTLTLGARLVIEGEIKDLFGRRRLHKMIKKLKDHYIVCGHGRMGRIICRELQEHGSTFLVVEKETDIGEALESPDYPILRGDATLDETLKEAGIEHAGGLISVLPTDAENLYVVLTARGLNASLNIVARAVEEGSEKKLLRAGADRVVSPYHIGGLRIAHTVLRPAVVDFIEFSTQSGTVDLRMEEIFVQEESRLVDQTLSQSGIGRVLGIIVIAIRKRDGTMNFNPLHDSTITAGDTLIVIGESPKLNTLERIAGTEEAPA